MKRFRMLLLVAMVAVAGLVVTACGTPSEALPPPNDGNNNNNNNNDITTPTSVAVPYALETNFVFNGQNQELTLRNFNSALMQIAGTLQATDAGSYRIQITLLDTVNTVWANGNTNAIVIDWTIARQLVTAPSMIQTEFAHTGNVITLPLNNFNPSVMTIENSFATNPGNHQARVTLTDPVNFQWAGNQPATLIFNWRILEPGVIPSLQSVVTSGGSFVFQQGVYRTATIHGLLPTDIVKFAPTAHSDWSTITPAAYPFEFPRFTNAGSHHTYLRVERAGYLPFVRTITTLIRPAGQVGTPPPIAHVGQIIVNLDRTQTLSDITLPNGFCWGVNAMNTIVSGTQTVQAIFNPNPGNFLNVTVSVTIIAGTNNDAAVLSNASDEVALFLARVADGEATMNDFPNWVESVIRPDDDL